MKTYQQLVRECLATVTKIMPWDLVTRLEDNNNTILVLDVRESYEFDTMRINGSISVPRGILEAACEWDYEETVPQLVQAREQEIVVVCHSGFRSALAALQMQLLGYQKVINLKTGLRGWKDYEQPLVDAHGQTVADDDVDLYFTPHVKPEQKRPRR